MIDLSTVPVATWGTWTVSIFTGGLIGSTVGALLNGWLTRRLEGERRERERLNILRLLDQWLVAQWETAAALGRATEPEQLDLVKVRDPFDTSTLDALMSRYVVDADEGELKTLFALRRNLALVNRAAQPLFGPQGQTNVHSPDRVIKALAGALPLIEDVHRWLRLKTSATRLRPQ